MHKSSHLGIGMVGIEPTFILYPEDTFTNKLHAINSDCPYPSDILVS